MSGWMVLKNGRKDGPFDDEELVRRVALGMIGPLDRVSKDGGDWRYLRGTEFWRKLPPARAVVGFPASAAPTADDASGQQDAENKTLKLKIDDHPVPAQIPDRLRLPQNDEAPLARRKLDERRFYVALAAGIAILIVVLTCMWFTMKREVPPTPAASATADNDSAGAIEDAAQSATEEELVRKEREREEAEAAKRVEAEKLLAEQQNAEENHSIKRAQESKATTNAVEVAPASKITLNEVKDKLVFVSVPDGTGSGFFVRLNGEVYLMTNEHVIFSEGPVTAKTIDGEAVELGDFSVATDRDLAIFKVDASWPAFSLAQEDPQEDEEVTVFGDSGGAGVISVSRGKILGYGPQQIETDADIIPGNSGGPILNARRELVAVSTLLTRETGEEGKDPKFWTVKGTRFEKTRRFGTRPIRTEWLEFDRNSYQSMVAKRDAVKAFLILLSDFVDVLTDKARSNWIPEVDLKNCFGHDRYGFAAKLRQIGEASRTYSNDRENHGKWRTFLYRYKEGLVMARDFIRRNDWPTPKLEEGFDARAEVINNEILRIEEILK